MNFSDGLDAWNAQDRLEEQLLHVTATGGELLALGQELANQRQVLGENLRRLKGIQLRCSSRLIFFIVAGGVTERAIDSSIDNRHQPLALPRKLLYPMLQALARILLFIALMLSHSSPLYIT